MRIAVRVVVTAAAMTVVSLLGLAPTTADEAASVKRSFPQGDAQFFGNNYMALTNGKGEMRFRWSFPDRDRRVTVVMYQTRANQGVRSPFISVDRDRLYPTRKGWSHDFTLGVKSSGGCSAWYSGSTFEITLVAMAETKPGVRKTIAYKRFTVPLVCTKR